MSSNISHLESVSIIIINYNAGALLTVCVRAGLEQARQVIVVDNASSDTSLTDLESSFPAESRLCVIRAGRNLGFAAGCNIGIKAASESYILFLNPDCVLGTGSLKRMIQVLEADSHTGMVGGLLINPDGSEQRGSRRAVPTPWRSFVRAFGLYRFANRYPRLFFDFYLHNQPLPDAPIAVEAISGALMLVRWKAIEDVGFWDDGYFLHCEDLDWCMRFRQKGWNIFFVPDATVAHALGTCSRSRPIFVEWHKHKGMMRFYRKFYQQQYHGLLMWLVALSVWLRFLVVAAYYSARHIARLLGISRG